MTACAWILPMYVVLHSQEQVGLFIIVFTYSFLISCLQSRVQIRWQNRGGDRFRYQRGCQGSGEDGPEKNPNLTNRRWKKQTSKNGDQIIIFFVLEYSALLLLRHITVRGFCGCIQYYFKSRMSSNWGDWSICCLKCYVISLSLCKTCDISVLR